MGLYDDYLKSKEEDDEEEVDLYAEYLQWKKGDTPSKKASKSIQKTQKTEDFLQPQNKYFNIKPAEKIDLYAEYQKMKSGQISNIPVSEKRSFGSRIKEGFETFVASLPSFLGGAKTGTGVALSQASDVSLDEHLASMEMQIEVYKGFLEQGWWWRGLRKVELTPEDIKFFQDKIAEYELGIEKAKVIDAQKKDITEKLVESGLKDFEKSVQNRRKVIEKYGEPNKWSGQWFLNETLANTPQFLGSFGLGLATGVITKDPTLALAVGFSSSYVQEAGGAYQTAKEAGLDDYWANSAANTVGIANATIEQLPLGRILNKTPNGNAIKKSILNNINQFIIERIKDGAYEGITESMQEIIANAVEKTYNEEKELFEGVLEAGSVGAILGTVGGTFGGEGQDYNIVPQANVIEREAVDNLNKAVMDAATTPDEYRTEEQKKLLTTIATKNTEKLQPVLDEAYKQTIKNGGVTISLEGNKPTEGYAYSPYKDSETVYEKESFTEDNISEFVDKFFDRLSEEGNHLGIWEDGGKIYIDISQVGEATEETISKAEQAGQLAVFDLKNFSTVYTKLGQQQQQIQDEKTNITNIPEGEKEGAVGIRDMGSISEVPAVTTKAEAGTKTTKAGVTKTTQKKLTSQEKTKEELGKRVSERGTIKFRTVGGIEVTPKNFNKIAKDIGTDLPTEFINTDSDDFESGAIDVQEGVFTMTSLPVLVKPDGKGKYDIIDGNHRVVQALNRGDKNIRVTTDEETYRMLSDFESGESPRYLKDKKGRFKGSVPKGTVMDKEGNIIGGEETRRAIEEYQKESTSKFRTEEELLQEKDRGVTTKFLELPDIKGKSFLSKSFIQNLSMSKGVGLKAYEFSVIQDVLNNQFADVDKINMIDFRKAVLSQMMPLDVIESDTYANYGIDNIGMDYSVDGEDAPKTYIFNSPFDHGNTGHFSQDFQSEEVSKKDVEIREVPIGDKTKFVVVKKGESLTEDNIEENVFTVTNTKEEAESWIEKHSVRVPVYEDGENKGYKAKYIKSKIEGLFGHFRATNQDDGNAYILEIQSDAFQKGVGLYAEIRDTEERISNLKEERGRAETNVIVAKSNEEVAASGAEKLDRENWVKVYQKEVDDLSKKIDDAETTLAQLKAREISKEEKVFNTYKNIWQERLVREAINIKANEGSKFIRFPTPRTVAVIEGFTGGEEGNTMPYEIINGDEESGLVAGDTIDYGGDTYVVVWADDYSITVAPENDVNSFDVDSYIEERVNADWDDVNYEYEKVVEEYGKDIDTIGDVKKILDTQDTLSRLHQYSKIDKDTKQEIDAFEGGERADYRFNISHIKDTIGEWERFAELIKNDIVHKENITKENVQNLDFKDNLVKKYRLPMRYWQYIKSAYRIWDTSKDIGIDEVSKDVIFDIEANIKEQKENLSIAEGSLEEVTQEHQRRLDDIKSRKKPTAKELKGIPQEMIDKATDPDSYIFGYNIESELESIFKEEVEKATGVDGVIDEEVIFSLDDLSEDWISNKTNEFDIDDDLSDMYNEYFIDDDRENAYVIISGNSESFSQPDQYDKTSSIEDFNIEDFDGTERTVLEFYNKQVIPYLKKLRSDLQLVEDNNGYQWWESQLTEKDLEPPTAYRVKDDFEQIGITITDKQEKQIMKLNKKMFGDASVKITEQILSNNKALGAYSKKIIQILSGQVNPKDTFYHEAVHKYIDVFLTKDEQADLFMAGAKKYKTNDIAKVEEMIAEDFISYAKSREGVTGKIKSIFDKIISRIQSYLGNQDIIEETYSDILKPYEAKLKPKKITKTAQKKAATKVKETIPTLMPVGEGEIRVSKLAKGVEARAVAEKLIKSFGDLPEYQRVSVDNQAERVTKLINEDWDTAVNIALGREESPYGLLPESVFIAVENKALEDGSVDLLRQLATSPRTSEATAMGQRIRMLAERNPDSAVNNIREVYNERKKASEKRGYNKEKEVAKVRKEVDNEVKKVSKYDWKSFIDSIEC